MKYVSRSSASLAIAACVLLAACAGDAVGTDTAALISDQRHHGGTPGFYFLSPTVRGPDPNGPFEARVAPVVRIDRIDPVTGATLAPVVTFDTTHRVRGGKVRRNTRRGYYVVRWRTDDFELLPWATYRINVLVDGRRLGFADVDVVRTRNEMRGVDRDEFVPLKLNGTLAIKFRIEPRAVDRDGDGVVDWRDNCPDTPNGPGQPPAPGTPHDWPGCDPEADECDPEEEDCGGGGDEQLDTDGDGVGDACECDGVVCAPADVCHDAGTCQSATGTCTTPTLPDDDDDGACNAIDGCPLDATKVEPGACGCGTADTDSDGDGAADCVDLCPQDPGRTEPGACGCGGAGGLDGDGDGTSDCVDGCPADPDKIAAGVCGCGRSDADIDGDGVPSCQDACPLDGDKLAPGVCGCGRSDVDTDGDGFADCQDACRLDPAKRVPGPCGCGVPDTDTDGDLVADCDDACALDPGKVEPGTCGCGVADSDSDGDGIADCIDACAADPAKLEPGACGCGVVEDPSDTDGDGSPDCVDACRFDAGKTAPGTCGCGLEDIDGDVDGIVDCQDPCPGDNANTCPIACVSEPLADATVEVGAPTAVTIDLLDVAVASIDEDGTLIVVPPGGQPSAQRLDVFFATPPGAARPRYRFLPNDAHSVLLEVLPLAQGGYLATVELSSEVLITACVSSPVAFAAACAGFTDFDLDGAADCDDECPTDPSQVAAGACGCGAPETDDNGNGVPDCLEW